jgi:hypothetical protein
MPLCGICLSKSQVFYFIDFDFRYLLVPALLGDLYLKLCSEERVDVVTISKVQWCAYVHALHSGPVGCCCSKFQSGNIFG